MSDSLNNMLMNLGSNVNFLNGNSNAASFAEVATDSIESDELTSGGDADNIRFIDLFRGEVKSFLDRSGSVVSTSDDGEEVTAEQLDDLVEQLIQQLNQNDSNTADIERAKGLVNGEPLDKTPKVTPEDQKIFISIIRQWQAELKSSANNEMTQNSGDELTQAPAEEFVQSTNDVHTDQATTSNESEQLIEPELSNLILTEKQLDFIEFVNNASPQELAKLAELTQLSPQQLIDVVSKVEDKATIDDSTILVEPMNQQPKNSSTDLLSKLEQLIAMQPANKSVENSLEKIKQLVEQPPEPVNLEQMIEQRVQQPIEQLINQSHQPKFVLTDEINGVANKEQLTQEVKKLISLLPNKDQKELVALINDARASDVEVKQAAMARVTGDAKATVQVSEAVVTDDETAEYLEKMTATDAKPKGQTGDNFDKMIKQMGWVSAANNEQSQERSILARQQADSDGSSAVSQVNERTDITGVKEAQVQNQVKAEAAQLAQKLPLHQETPAAKMLKERLTMMANGNIGQAVIQLDPEELGGMSIKLQIHNDQMNIQFVVQNPQAKELLENAMGKLREMLEQQGIALNEADVRQNDQRQNQQFDDSQGSHSESSDELITDQEAIVLTLTKQSADGIDYYA